MQVHSGDNQAEEQESAHGKQENIHRSSVAEPKASGRGCPQMELLHSQHVHAYALHLPELTIGPSG